VPGVTVFHAGTARPDPAGPFVTAGGRVLSVSALGPDLETARRAAYEGASRIRWAGAHHRGDVARTAAQVATAPAPTASVLGAAANGHGRAS